MINENFLKYDFGSWHPFKPYRWKRVLEILESKRVFREGVAEKIIAREATEEELLLIHTREYIEFVKNAAERDQGFLDYGDTPARRGVFEGALARVGATLHAVDLVLEKRFDHAFNPCGGFHHAKPGSAAGFCVFNDIAIAARYAQKRYGIKRIAVIDVDGHHGDGTQEIFYRDPSVLTISLHRYGIYPGTGWFTEVGAGEGEGYNINIPFMFPVDDSFYIEVFRGIVVPVVRQYRPELIILQYGADSHYLDPLAGVGLTTYGYSEIMRIVHELSHELSDKRLVVTGGGGYDIDVVARVWSIGFMILAGLESDTSDLHDKIDPRTIEKPRQDVREYIERIKSVLRRYYKDL